MQVKAIGEENLANKLQSMHMPLLCVFHVSVNIGEENFGEWLMICQIRRFPLPKFSRIQYRQYYEQN